MSECYHGTGRCRDILKNYMRTRERQLTHFYGYLSTCTSANIQVYEKKTIYISDTHTPTYIIHRVADIPPLIYNVILAHRNLTMLPNGHAL